MLKWEDPKLIHFGRGVEAIGTPTPAVCNPTGNAAKYGCSNGDCGGWLDSCGDGGSANGGCVNGPDASCCIDGADV